MWPTETAPVVRCRLTMTSQPIVAERLVMRLAAWPGKCRVCGRGSVSSKSDTPFGTARNGLRTFAATGAARRGWKRRGHEPAGDARDPSLPRRLLRQGTRHARLYVLAAGFLPLHAVLPLTLRGISSAAADSRECVESARRRDTPQHAEPGPTEAQPLRPAAGRVVVGSGAGRGGRRGARGSHPRGRGRRRRADRGAAVCAG